MNSPKTSNNLTKIPDSIDSKFSLSSSPPSPLIHNSPLNYGSLSADDKFEKSILDRYGDSNDPDYAALGVSSVSKYNPVYLDLDDFANPSPLSESSSTKSSSTKSSAKKSSAKTSYSKKRKSKKSKAGSKNRNSKKTNKRRY